MTVQEPVGTPKTEIELEVQDGNCFFVRLSAETDCLIRLEELIHRADGDPLQYVSIRETPPEDVLDVAASESAIAEARLVGNGPDGNPFQFVASGPRVTATPADTGAITRDVSAAGGVGRVVATVPAHVAVRTVVETFRTQHSESEFLARRERNLSTPVRTRAGVDPSSQTDLPVRRAVVSATCSRSPCRCSRIPSPFFVPAKVADSASSGWLVTCSDISELNHVTLPNFYR